jgi:hypothetical protein
MSFLLEWLRTAYNASRAKITPDFDRMRGGFDEAQLSA